MTVKYGWEQTDRQGGKYPDPIGTCDGPCRSHAMCRLSERYGARCHWRDHQPGVNDLSQLGRRITAHALRLQRGERSRGEARAQLVAEYDAPP